MLQTGGWICWSRSRNSRRADVIGSHARRVTAQARSQNMRDWLARRRAERLPMRGRQNGPGSNDAAYLCENGHLSGKFLAKLIPLMEDIQQTGCATFMRE
jgi:hypothetical protein